MKTWNNGAKGGEVKGVIEHNFNVVSKYLSKDVRALSTRDRNMLSSEYLSEGTLVFDTDEEQWYKYSGSSWIKMAFGEGGSVAAYKRNIYVSSWINNSITILFEEHCIEKPVVQLYMKDGDSFIPVLGGIKIDTGYNVILSTDLPFDGKVVIK